MAQWAAAGVSVLEFRGITSPIDQLIFQNSTPMFQSMSIEQSNFTARSQYILAKASRNRFCEALFFVYCPASFEVSPPLI